MLKKAAIVYCSPAGSTRRVAQVMEKALTEAGIGVLSADFGKGGDGSSIIAEMKNREVSLFIGSPVYVNRPIPPVMNFISELPNNAAAWAVPFVTWGGVSSGIALYEMGKALTDKGFVLAGAAKVVALHSMMWRCDNPLGEGHPDEGDEKRIRELVAGVLKKTGVEPSEGISLSDLAYQPETVHGEMEKVTLETAKAHMPGKAVDEGRCTECGVCEEICPVQAITLSPYPEFGRRCICCFQCVRGCPEAAILADLSPVEARIRSRAEQLKEHPLTKIWV